ncbi:Ff.00g041320.m01.CDS01 [Fusarium sp. VM40]|nr:Ff.00g041320.m01.CDS01 [Fusarium sp. VM40]
MFSSFQKGPVDPMYLLKTAADNDVSPQKADLGVGIYRNESGLYSELKTVTKAKKVLAKNDPGHDYEITIGNEKFLNNAARVMFGQDCQLLNSGNMASVRTVSGTGACHIAALALSESISPRPKVFVGTPTWGNYKPIFELVGMKVTEYSYLDANTRTIDFSSIISAAESAPPRSVFILQACCHNPTGVDPTKEQWQELGSVMKEHSHFVFFDIAYQGLGNGVDEDAYAVRLFASLGLEMFVCQSFSKNFALYGERCGVLHAVCPDRETAANVRDRLRCLIRWEFSSSPAYGSRLVTIVLGSNQLADEWAQELHDIQHRLKSLRKQLHYTLTEVLHTPGSWDHILLETGLFSYLNLTPQQCQSLIDKFHIYLPSNGRINISGLNQDNILRVAKSFDQVVREEISKESQPRASL